MTGEKNKPDDNANKDVEKNTPKRAPADNKPEVSDNTPDTDVKADSEKAADIKPNGKGDEKSVKESADKNIEKKTKENAKENTAENKTVKADKAPTPSKQNTSNSSPKANTKASSKDKSSKLSGLILIILLLLIAGLSVGIFYGLQFWQDYSTKQEKRFAELESINSEQLAKIESISREQKTKNSDQAELLNTIRQEQNTLQEQLNQRLDSHTERLRSLAGTSRNDWLLAEARYLLRLASQRLLVENSTVGAQALLQSADNILLSIDDPELLPIRSAIAQETIALKLAKNVDRPGIYLQLSALKDQIQALPLIPFRPEPEANTVSKPLENSEPKKWYSPALNSFNKALEELKSFVKIREHDQVPELLISEQQQLQLISNLMLMLEQAQYSLLHEEELIYQESLKKAQKWWRDFYSHYPEYEVVNHEINKLLNKEITQTIPSINRSAKLLTDYIDRFHKINSDSASDNSSSETEEKAL